MMDCLSSGADIALFSQVTKLNLNRFFELLMSQIKSKFTNCWLLIFLVVAISPVTHARDSILFTCSIDKSEPQYEDLLDLYKEAFDAFDMEFSMRPESARRAMASAASGQTDGDCTRVHDYIEVTGVTTLVRVDVPVVSVEAQVWTRLRESDITSMGQLPEVGKRVGYRRGIKWIEVYLEQQQGIEAITVNATELGFKMLAAERLDIYIASGMQASNVLNSLSLRRPIYLAGTLATVDFFPYLHKRHKHLAVPLAAELRRLIDARGGPIK